MLETLKSFFQANRIVVLVVLAGVVTLAVLALLFGTDPQ